MSTTSSSYSHNGHNNNGHTNYYDDDNGDGMMMNSGPVVLKRSLVPDDIICSICMSVPQDPVVTKLCDHVFCRNCLYQSIQSIGSVCPMDRKPCQWHTDVTSLREGSFIYRIWCNVQVKCQYYGRGCSWTGSIQDFVQSHKEGCFYNNTNRTINRLYPYAARYGRVEDSDEYIALQNKYNQLQSDSEKIKTDLYTSQTTLQQLRHDVNNRITINAATLRPNVGSFDNTYQYYRDDVVKLTTLIVTWLENKPDSIDPSRIYNCIQRCYVAQARDYNDNPPCYDDNIRMLLATAAASNWFSERQYSNICSWLYEQGWAGVR